MSQELADDFLAHYGVKGMKWGKRKAKTTTEDDQSEETPKRSYPKITKKQAIIGASILVGVAVAAVVIANRGDIKASMIGAPAYLKRNGDQNSRVNMLLRKHGDRKDIVLPQGKVFKRISTVAETNIRDVTYAAYGKKDIADYTAHYGSGKHQITLETTKDIKLPSRKNKISTLSGMLDSPLSSPEYKNQTLREVLLNQERSAKGKEFLNAASSKKLAGLVYDRLDTDDFRTGYGKEFLNKLKDKGYSAISDPIDGYSNRDTASILIDSSVFKIVGSKKLSADDLASAKAEFRKLLRN